jgi:putative Ca2+/H+ antiporter (TMEM165/GDT1 family)
MRCGRRIDLEALFTSTAVVALAEIGDKTQLLAIVLAARFKRPWPIIAGILVATLGNHFLAALVGEQAASILDGRWFRYLIAASFIVMAGWTLVPDKLDEDETTGPAGRFGPFLATTIAFFLVEMGDKTQVATIALGARFQTVFAVTAGTTLGMLIANVPAVFLGHEIIKRVPLAVVRVIAAMLFLAIGVWVLAQTAGWIPS